MSPPLPPVSSELLARCARLAFQVVPGAALGVFRDESTGRELPLLIVADPSVAGGTAWALEGDGATIPFVMDGLTYAILHGGAHALEHGGAIIWQGRHYRLAAAWDGARPMAVATHVPDRERVHAPAVTTEDPLGSRGAA